MTEAAANPTDAQQQIERNFRWNFLVNTVDGTFFSFGISFFSSKIILPLFVSHYTSSPLVIGLITFLGWSGVLLPQVFMANIIERAPRKKFFAVNLGFFLERLPLLLLPLAVYFLAVDYPLATLIIFFALYGWHNFGAGIIIVGWQDLIAKVIPTERRGRFFGISNFLGYGMGILGALAVPLLLDRNPFPRGYVIAFSITGVCVFLSWVMLSLTREPAVASAKAPVSQAEYLRSLPEILRKDRNFRSFLLAQIISALSGMAGGFLVIYSAERWNLPDAQASAFMIALQVGLAVAFLFFGFLADRKGHKLILEICFLSNFALLLLAIAAPGPLWFYPIFFLSGAVQAGNILSGFAIVYEFTAAETRPTYIGLANTIPGIGVTVAPLIGGWLAGAVGYRAMFTAALVLAAASWLLLRFTVREPRAAAKV
ncbi:MAG TPA: MFS transporter [Anaerolineaceae bacterium]